MRWLAPLCLFIFITSHAHAEAIGVFTATSGDVQILRGQDYLAAAPGVDVEREDIVETGAKASAQLEMEDDSVLKLGPDTRIALSDYQLDSNKGVVSATLDVLSGWMRFAVAKLKPEGRYRIQTPILTVGIRGTEGILEAQGEQSGLHLSEGVVDVEPIGDELKAVQPVRIHGGEYVQRARRQPLNRLDQPPTTFRNRLPPALQQRLVRRAHELRQRGVPPRAIRAMTREEMRRFLERHPQMRERMRERFKQSGAALPPAPRNRDEALRRREQQRNKAVRPEAGSSERPAPRRPANRSADGDQVPNRPSRQH